MTASDSAVLLLITVGLAYGILINAYRIEDNRIKIEKVIKKCEGVNERC